MSWNKNNRKLLRTTNDLAIYRPMCGIFYFPYHRHQILVSLPKDTCRVNEIA